MRTSNFISLTGSLGAAVELKKSTPGAPESEVARLRIAETVSRPNPTTKLFEPVHTNWIPVTAFASLARRAAKSLKKGDRITVFGTLKTTTYEKDGQNRRGFEVIAHSIEKAQLLSKAEVLATSPDTPPDTPDETLPDFPSFEEFNEETVGFDTTDRK